MAEADARSMLTIARRDLKAAWILQDASIAEASWGFQVQQVVEKALKAWLFQLGDSLPFTHDLVVLFKRLLRVGADVKPIVTSRGSPILRCSSVTKPNPNRWASIVPSGCNVPSSSSSM